MRTQTRIETDAEDQPSGQVAWPRRRLRGEGSDEDAAEGPHA